MIRSMLHGVSYGLIQALKPLKLYAYTTRVEVVKRAILESTTFVDFCLIWLNIQNETMLLHAKAFGGNFIFGKGVMITDHPTTAREIDAPSLRGNHFMGVNIVASDSNMFATNSAILNQSPPAREATRGYLDRSVFTPAVRALDLEGVRASVAAILADWKAHPQMATSLVIRSTVTRIFIKLLAGVTLPVDEAEFTTTQYIRRFVETSLFAGYAPALLGLLGTFERVRKDAFYRLRDRGIDLMVVDVTLFAAMFSIGTLVIRCVEDTRRFGVRYRDLDARRKRNFVFEAVRLYPTVTAVHRKLDKDEEVVVAGRKLKLTAGDEVVYPFACSNRDPSLFPDPERLDLDRPEAQRDAVLSWSRGPHVCPAKELSILVTTVMLDTLSERYELHELDIFNPSF